MSNVLLLTFLKNEDNENLYKYLTTENECDVSCFEIDRFSIIDINHQKYDRLIIGDCYFIPDNFTHDITSQIPNFINLSVIFDVIELFAKKPIIGIGFGCFILSIYYGYTIIYSQKNQYHPSNITNINIDKRYLINKDYSHKYTYVKLTTNPVIIKTDNHYEISPLMIVSNTFDIVGYRFMYKHHYGVLFDLTSTQFAIHVLNQFIHKIHP